MTRPLRVMLYAHNTRGLGHAARMVGLAWGISGVLPDANILCCTGGMQGLADLLPTHADFVKLPSFDAVEQVDSRQVLLTPILNVERSVLISMRRAIISAVAETYDPDVLIADYTPLGKDEELKQAITSIRNRGRRLILLGLRDILNDSDRANAYLEAEVIQPLRNYFDAALIYSDPNWTNFVENHNIPIELQKHFIHTGYVVNNSLPCRSRFAIRQELNIPEGDKLVVLGLGGGKDATEILAFAVNAWEIVINQLPFNNVHCLILSGPYIRHNQWQFAQERVKTIPSIHLLHHVLYPLEYLRAAEMYIGACGYNAFTEVMQAKIPAIFIPRIQIDSDEQLIRATQLKAKGNWGVIDIRQSSAANLADSILQNLIANPVMSKPIDLDGATCVGNFLAQWSRIEFGN